MDLVLFGSGPKGDLTERPLVARSGHQAVLMVCYGPCCGPGDRGTPQIQPTQAKTWRSRIAPTV